MSVLASNHGASHVYTLQREKYVKTFFMAVIVYQFQSTNGDIFFLFLLKNTVSFLTSIHIL